MADAIEGVVQMIAAPIQKVRPKKATVKFGMKLAIESGQLTAVIVKGSGKANLGLAFREFTQLYDQKLQELDKPFSNR